MSVTKRIEQAFELAKESYAEFDVDVESAMQTTATIPVSIHCWQGDDVSGFENTQDLSGGIMATGNYPGKAKTPDELRADLAQALALIPGKHKVNLHAIYAETAGRKVERCAITAEHFQGWIAWAKERQLGLDYNPSYFSHPKADAGFTLASADAAIRDYWIAHGKNSRQVAAAMGQALGQPAVMNTWIPDGYKDVPVDLRAPRARLADSLDQIFAEALPPTQMLDAVECKLFGIGSEAYVVGSHEFYMGYAVKNKKLLCLDAGHFHPTEVISDKISACLLFVDQLLLHVSRSMRWDSDHIVTLTDELRRIAYEIVTNNCQNRVHIGLDFFDASVNRIAAWTIGTRNMVKALLEAALFPLAKARQAENAGDLTARLMLQEEMKSMPVNAVWDMYCLRHDVPVGQDWFAVSQKYEQEVLAKRQ